MKRENGSAPMVCPITRNQPLPPMRPPRAPVIPQATNLPSVIAAIDAINLILQDFAAAPPGNNLGPGSPPGSGEEEGGDGSPYKKKGWEEVSRNTEICRIYDPENKDRTTMGKTDYVDLPRITELRYKENRTDTYLIWNL